MYINPNENLTGGQWIKASFHAGHLRRVVRK
jgi:hypothetical protein